MTTKRSWWVFVGLIPVLFSVSGCQTPLNASAKRHVLAAVGRTLSRQAYVYGVDFSREHWREMSQTEREGLDSAETDEAFADAIQTVLEGYGVSHLACFSAAKAGERRHGHATGVGILGVELDDGILAAGVIAGSPAAHAGIQRGDLIVSIDDAPARTRKQFRGEPGQVRRLEWWHDGSPRTGEVVQARFRRASPDELVWLDDDIAWITVHSFSKSLYHRGRIEVFFESVANSRGVILDLRGNLGGYVNNVAHLAGQVLDRDARISVIIFQKTLDAYDRKKDDGTPSLADLAAFTEKKLSATARRDREPYRGKLIVLVDSLSGSGGELLPAALQELGRARVIGAVSFGRVLLADTFSLPRGFRLHLPIGEILTPGGQRIEGVGVQPDVLLTPRQAADDDYIISLAREAILR